MKLVSSLVLSVLAAATCLAQTPAYSASWSELTGPDAAGANAVRGAASMKARADAIARALRAIKADDSSLRLQTEFFEASRHPLQTNQIK